MGREALNSSLVIIGSYLKNTGKVATYTEKWNIHSYILEIYLDY